MRKYLYKDLYQLEDKHWWHVAKRNNVITFIKKFAKKSPLKILDIGCGTGKNVETFLKFGEAYGIDNAASAIAYCKKRGLKNITLESAEKTNLIPSQFDVITLLDVLEHVDDNKTLNEAYRLLKPGGIVIVTVPAFQFLWSQWDVVLHHKRRYTKKSIAKLLGKNDFQVLKISYMFSFLFLPAFFIRFIKSKISQKHYSSDFRLNSTLLNYLGLFVSKLDSFFVYHYSLPIGTSIICIAKK